MVLLTTQNNTNVETTVRIYQESDGYTGFYIVDIPIGTNQIYLGEDQNRPVVFLEQTEYIDIWVNNNGAIDETIRVWDSASNS